jgi:uncharacterized membrane protein
MMVATQDQGGRRPAARGPNASPTRVIVGITLMVLGVALMSYGAHFVASTGTCSGTGYAYYGPVPKCSGDEALYITSAFFVGPLAAIIGWIVAPSGVWLWPAVCVGVGTGLITISVETTATTGARAFGGVGGICLFALAGRSVIVTLRKRRGAREAGAAAGPGTTVLASTPAPARLVPAGLAPARLAPPATRAPAADRSDPLATIARLAQLRDAGALTEDEFEFQKAKLLAEI